MSKLKVQIRKGEKKDLPAVLTLIKELADYEKQPDEVVVTLAEMEEWGFGKEPVFSFFVAETEGVIRGMALYYVKYSTWKGKCIFLDDIVVNEQFRRHGIGTLLFNEVVKVSKALKVRKMEWQVLDWNTPAIEFYKKYKTHFDGEWINCKLTEEFLWEKVNS